MSNIRNVKNDNRFIFPNKFGNLESVKSDKPGVKKYDKFVGFILKFIGKAFHLEKGSHNQETWMNKKSVIKFINHNRMEFLAVLPTESVLEKPLTKKTSRLVLQRLIINYLEKGPSKGSNPLLEPHHPLKQQQQPISPIRDNPPALPSKPDPIIAVDQPSVDLQTPPSTPVQLEPDENDPSNALNTKNPETPEIDHTGPAALPEKKAYSDWNNLYTIQPLQTPTVDNPDQPQKAEITLQFENQVKQLIQDFQFDPEIPPSTLLEHFAARVDQEQSLKYITEHFDIDPELAKKVVLDEKSKLNQLSLVACLQLINILKPITPENSAIVDLENTFKNALKIKHNFIDEPISPIAYSTWAEIPLRELLILSDRQTYHLERGGDDYKYLFDEMVQKNTMKSPMQIQYSQEDQALFLEKCKRLNLNTKPVIAQATPIEEARKEPLGLTPYQRVERLIKILCETEEFHDISDIIENYCPLLLGDDTIQSLYIKELDNVFIGLLANEESQICNLHSNNLLKKQNRRQFAIYLWNALVNENHIPAECPEPLKRWAGKFGLRRVNNKFITPVNRY